MNKTRFRVSTKDTPEHILKQQEESRKSAHLGVGRTISFLVITVGIPGVILLLLFLLVSYTAKAQDWTPDLLGECTLDGHREDFRVIGQWWQMTVHKDKPLARSGNRTRAQLTCWKNCPAGSTCTLSFVMRPYRWKKVDKPITIMDYHSIDDDCDEPGRAGPFNLQIIGDNLVAKVHSDVATEGKCSKRPHMNLLAQKRVPISLYWETAVKVEYRGRWDDTGYVKLWVNGEQVWHYKGVTSYHDGQGTFGKLGPYMFKWDGWPVDRVTVRLRDIQWGRD